MTNKLYAPVYQTAVNPAKVIEFARDMAIYGADDFDGVITSHGFEPAQAAMVMGSEMYKAEYQRVMEQLTTPHAAVRMKAQNMLAMGIDVVGEIAAGQFQPAAARLKAVDMLAKLAGAEQEQANDKPQVVVMLDFGGVVQVTQPTVTIQNAPSQSLPAEAEEVVSTGGWTLEE